MRVRLEVMQMPDCGEPDELLDIREVSARTGLRASALRYYEQSGLIAPAGRRSNQRVYHPEVLKRLALIALCRRNGFSLAEVRVWLIAAQYRDRHGWQALTAQKIAELDRQIQQSIAMRDRLRHALDCPSPDILDCPHLASALDDALPGRQRTTEPTTGGEQRAVQN